MNQIYCALEYICTWLLVTLSLIFQTGSSDVTRKSSEDDKGVKEQAKTFGESVKHFEDEEQKSVQGEKEGMEILGEINKAVSDHKDDTVEGKGVIGNVIDTLDQGE